MFDCAEFCSADAVGMIGNGVGDGVGDGIKVRFLRAEGMGKLRASNLESLKALGVHIALLEGLAPQNHKKSNAWQYRLLISQGPCYFNVQLRHKTNVQIKDFGQTQGTAQ